MRYLRFHSPMFQFSAFMGLFLGLYLISYFIISSFSGALPSLTELTPETATPAVIARYKWMQLLSTVLSFLAPAFLFNYLSDPKPLRYAGFQPQTHPALLTITVLLLAASLPAVGLLGEWNSQINWGSAQATVEEVEKAYETAMTTLLQMKGPGDLIINVLLMAALPALAEEFFFRGTLQQVLFRWWRSPFASVLGSSLFFALMHGTFSKIIPIFAMGFLLGTLFMITRNIWCSILFHFLFNGMQIVLMYLSQRGKISGFDAESQEFSFPVWAGLTGMAAILLIFAYLQKEKRKWIPAEVFRNPPASPEE